MPLSPAMAGALAALARSPRPLTARALRVQTNTMLSLCYRNLVAMQEDTRHAEPGAPHAWDADRCLYAVTEHGLGVARGSRRDEA